MVTSSRASSPEAGADAQPLGRACCRACRRGARIRRRPGSNSSCRRTSSRYAVWWIRGCLHAFKRLRSQRLQAAGSDPASRRRSPPHDAPRAVCPRAACRCGTCPSRAARPGRRGASRSGRCGRRSSCASGRTAGGRSCRSAWRASRRRRGDERSGAETSTAAAAAAAQQQRSSTQQHQQQARRHRRRCCPAGECRRRATQRRWGARTRSE